MTLHRRPITLHSVQALLTEIFNRRKHTLSTYGSEDDEPPALGFRDKTEDECFVVSMKTLQAHYGDNTGAFVREYYAAKQGQLPS